MESYYLFQIAIGIVGLITTIFINMFPYLSSRKVKRALSLIDIYNKAPIAASFSSTDMQIYTILQGQIQENICDVIGYEIDDKTTPPYVRKKSTILKDALIPLIIFTVLSTIFALFTMNAYKVDFDITIIASYVLASWIGVAIAMILINKVLKKYPKKEWNKFYVRNESEKKSINEMLARVKELDEMKKKNLDSELLIKAVRQVFGRS